MSSKTVLITGAAGNIGRKLQTHFVGLGWTLRLFDIKGCDGAVKMADFSGYDESWARHFADIDAVVHLAANPTPWADWPSIYKNNWLATENVLRAAMRHRIRRFVFASSNWVMADYLSGHEKLTTSLLPKPINHYGYSKLYGEHLGKIYADKGLSFIAFRIGGCQSAPGNRPGAHMGSRWEQLKWLSDRDLCQAMERSVLQDNVDYAVLNLMSDNPGMRWDIQQTKDTLRYIPQDGVPALLTPKVYLAEWREYIRYKIHSRS